MLPDFTNIHAYPNQLNYNQSDQETSKDRLTQKIDQLEAQLDEFENEDWKSLRRGDAQRPPHLKQKYQSINEALEQVEKNCNYLQDKNRNAFLKSLEKVPEKDVNGLMEADSLKPENLQLNANRARVAALWQKFEKLKE